MCFHLSRETTLSWSKVFPKYLNVVLGVQSSRGTSITRTGWVLKLGDSRGEEINLAGVDDFGGGIEEGSCIRILEKVENKTVKEGIEGQGTGTLTQVAKVTKKQEPQGMKPENQNLGRQKYRRNATSRSKDKTNLTFTSDGMRERLWCNVSKGTKNTGATRNEIKEPNLDGKSIEGTLPHAPKTRQT
jgi:hypothetical protein